MKIPKTLAFIVPIPFIASLFAISLSFSALMTISDDPFRYGTWPDVVAAASIHTVLALIIGEIVSDFTFEVFRIAIPCALLISWRAARGYLKGIAKERQIWIPWYRRQETAIVEERMLGKSPLAGEQTRTDTYFRITHVTALHLFRHLMYFIVHFSCWFSGLVLFVIIFTRPVNGIKETAYYLMNFFPDIAISATIPAFLSSLVEAITGRIGAAKERQVWTQWYDMRLKWYQRQQGAKTHGYTLAERPPLPPLNANQLP